MKEDLRIIYERAAAHIRASLSPDSLIVTRRFERPASFRVYKDFRHKPEFWGGGTEQAWYEAHECGRSEYLIREMTASSYFFLPALTHAKPYARVPVTDQKDAPGFQIYGKEYALQILRELEESRRRDPAWTLSADQPQDALHYSRYFKAQDDPFPSV